MKRDFVLPPWSLHWPEMARTLPNATTAGGPLAKDATNAGPLTGPGSAAAGQSTVPDPSGRELLRMRIQTHLGRMSRKQRALAQHIIDNPARVSFETAGEIGAAVGTSAATVVRFAQLLGYEGFSELRESLRKGLLPFPTFQEQLDHLSEQPLNSSDDLIKLVLGYDRENLETTAAMLDADALMQVAKQIQTARRTILIGTGVGGAVVQLLAGHLTRLGLSILVPYDPVHAVITLANVQPDDLVLGVTFYRFARSTNDLLVSAKRRGAVTAAIVDSPLFPAADHVDHLLVVSSRNAGHGPSAVAAVTAVNCLVSATILTDFPRFYAAIEQIDAAYEEAHIYMD